MIWYLFFSLFLTYNQKNLKKNWTFYQKAVAGYFFAAWGVAIFANAIMVLITKNSKSDKEDYVEGIRNKNLLDTKISTIKRKNYFWFFFLLIINFGLFVGLFFSAIGFSAYWEEFSGIMEVCIPIMFGIDFLFDIILSFVLTVLYKCNLETLFRIFNIFKISRCL